MSPESLRRRLTLRLGAVMLLFSLAASVAVYRLALRFGTDGYDQWLLNTARSLTLVVRPLGGGLALDVPAPTLRAVIYDTQDKVLFRIDDDTDGLIAGEPAMHMPGLEAGQTMRYDDIMVDGKPMRAVQIAYRDGASGQSVRIAVAETLTKRHKLASRVLAAVMGLVGLFSVLAITLARNAVTRGLAPLSDLADIVRQRRHDDLTPLPQHELPQELQTFASSINGLLQQLEQAVQGQRRFIADAAHQLRTPLAALRAELDYALREPDRGRRQEALTRLNEGLQRLSRVANQLLTLARAEPGALASTGFEHLDLRELAHQAGMRWLPRFMAAGMDIGFEADAAPVVRGDALLLEEVLNNLLDNTLRYAGAGRYATVKVSWCEGMASVAVEDDGPGVPADEIAHLTQRFHRSANGTSGGSGLGLAIIDEITRLHCGKLSIERVVPQGLSVRVILPCVELKPIAQEPSGDTHEWLFTTGPVPLDERTG